MKQNNLLKIFILLFLGVFVTDLKAQKDSVEYHFGTSVLLSTGRYSPFWLHSNRYGAITERGAGFNTEAGFAKAIDSSGEFDYGYGATAVFLSDNQKTLLIPQEYLWFLKI